MKNLIAFFIVLTAGFALEGCAGLPGQFANENPPLSQNDQNIVIAAATVRQDMPEIEIGIETATPLALNAACKQPATLIRVGGFVYLVGTGLEAAGGTGTISPTIVLDSASHLNTTIDDAALLQQILTSGNAAFQGVNAHLQALANSATNPDVKAYVLGTATFSAGGVGTALCYSTEQYAPTVASAPAQLAYAARIHRARLHAATLLAFAKHDPADLHRVMLAYLND